MRLYLGENKVYKNFKTIGFYNLYLEENAGKSLVRNAHNQATGTLIIITIKKLYQMKNVKLAVIYYSSTGTNYQLAQWAEKAGKDAGAAEVKLLKIAETAQQEAIAENKEWKDHLEATKDVPEVSLKDLEWADAVVFSAPTRYGNLPSQVAAFFDTTGGLWFTGKLANKVVSGMTSAQNTHGGQETTLLSLYKTMHHWGAIVAAPGYTNDVLFAAGGNPYGVSVTAGKENLTEKVRKAVVHQTERTLEVAGWVKTGSSNH